MLLFFKKIFKKIQIFSAPIFQKCYCQIEDLIIRPAQNCSEKINKILNDTVLAGGKIKTEVEENLTLMVVITVLCVVSVSILIICMVLMRK